MSQINQKNPEIWHGKEAILNNVIQESPTSKWGGLEVNWNEDITKKDKTINHVFRFTVNRNTGDFYLDCDKRKLTLKFSLYAVLQPLIFSVKTVYHLLLPISIPYEIFREVQKIKLKEAQLSQKIASSEKAKRIVKVVVWNVASIVITPGCAAVSAIIGIAGAIIGPFAPKRFLYELRATAGKVERFTHRGDKNSIWIIYKCFQPVQNISTIEKLGLCHQSGKEYKVGKDPKGGNTFPNTHQDTLYQKDITNEERGMINLARAMISFRRTKRALFNDCMQLFPQEKEYISSYVEKKRSEPQQSPSSNDQNPSRTNLE